MVITIHFNCFLIHIATTRGSLGSFPGVILPKINKNHTFLPCYPKRSPPTDVLTISNDFRNKKWIITTHFNCFLIHIANNRGSLGSFPGVILLKIDENHTFLPCYPKGSPPIDVLTVLNYFRHWTGIIKICFNCFLIHIATTRGSLGSFPGVIYPKSTKTILFCHVILRDHPNRCFNYIERLQAQEMDHNDSFQLFSYSYSQ